VLEVAERRGQHLAAEVATEVGQRLLREAVEQEARHRITENLARHQPREPHDEKSPREAGAVERGVDQRDEPRAAGTADEPDHDGCRGEQPRAQGDEREEAHVCLGGDPDVRARSMHILSCAASTRTCGSCSISPESSPGAL
jgi:hypothetical protein